MHTPAGCVIRGRVDGVRDGYRRSSDVTVSVSPDPASFNIASSTFSAAYLHLPRRRAVDATLSFLDDDHAGVAAWH